MRGRLIALLLVLAPPAWAEDVIAGAPTALSVTVYRAPDRNGGSIELDNLGGFALVKETRTVHLPAGESRLKFEGVVDGILAASAIVTGLPRGVIEKNRNAAVLSPEALVRAAVGAQVTLVRTNRKTGKISRTPATIRSANDEGVVFETAAGIEALRCSGLPETFSFARVPAGLSSTPTLSVLTRSPRATTATVTLSYLADGFDWAANYVATVAPDGRTLNLGGWITLANGNGASLPVAHTQIVAGRLNWGGVDSSQPEASAVIAECWPQGTTTSDLPAGVREALESLQYGTSVGEVIVTAERMRAPAPLAAPPPPAPPPPPEQLGDLKLYRVANLTTLAARQSKQVRLIDQADVPFTRVTTIDLVANGASQGPAASLLRTKNDLASHLGLPLPAGRVAVFSQVQDQQMLTAECDLRDTAVDEDVEIQTGIAPDIQVTQTRLSREANAPQITPLTNELAIAVHSGQVVEQVEITNARDAPAPFELRLQTYGSLHVVDADQPMAIKDGRPIFRLILPANGSARVRYVVTNR
jgi:hypothetical protein